MSYTQMPTHHDVEETRRVITKSFNVNDDRQTWLVAVQDSDDVIGLAGIRRSAPHSVAMGGLIGRPWWGTGFASEGVRVLLAALQDNPEIYRAWATCDIDNTRLLRLFDQRGFAFEGRLARHAVRLTIGPQPRDSLLYAKVLR